MPAFEVTLNGKTLGTAGDSGARLLIAAAMAGERLAQGGQLENYLELSVSGVTNTEHLYWVDQLALSHGDEIRIRVVELAGSSDPVRRSPKAPE